MTQAQAQQSNPICINLDLTFTPDDVASVLGLDSPGGGGSVRERLIAFARNMVAGSLDAFRGGMREAYEGRS